MDQKMDPQMSRVYNFSAGPAVLPEAILTRARDELLNYQGLGYSILEMSHRTKPYEDLYQNIIELFRKTLAVPNNYQILLLSFSLLYVSTSKSFTG